MILEGQYTEHRITINADPKTNKIVIAPMGDIHFDSETCARDKFYEYMHEAKKLNAYYLGMGDYLDFAAWGDRKKIKNAGLHSNTAQKIDSWSNEDLNYFIEQTEQCKGKTIGLLSGNHEWVNEKTSMTGTETIANAYGCPVLGHISFIRLSLIFGVARKSCMDIVCCHGKAGGKLAGTPLNQVEDLMKVFPSADLYIMGHDHTRGGWPLCRLFPCNDTRYFYIKSKEQWLCRSGSFQKAYENGKGGYISGKFKSPSSLGGIFIEVSRKRHTHNENGKMKDNSYLQIRVTA